MTLDIVKFFQFFKFSIEPVCRLNTEKEWLKNDLDALMYPWMTNYDIKNMNDDLWNIA